jgi:glycosyltransferase involved in cell wall biosynthesis
VPIQSAEIRSLRPRRAGDGDCGAFDGVKRPALRKFFRTDFCAARAVRPGRESPPGASTSPLLFREGPVYSSFDLAEPSNPGRRAPETAPPPMSKQRSPVSERVESSAVSARPERVSLDVSVVMPCLDEARTIGTCIDKARRALDATGLDYEIVVGDNGSTDGSQKIAADLGARVVPVAKRGYGNAYIGALAEARGRVIVIGDSDDSYDWLAIAPFIAKVNEGYDLVMGSRFAGGIAPGAMPPMHRYVGNPVLTGVLNLFFRAGISDAHCGMRAFTREALDRMTLKTGGMEFASEMIIRAAQERLRIAEIPTTLAKDGRDRPPHLRSFHDGWRHLRFMLMFSPSWLFMAPALVAGLIGFVLVALLPFFEIRVLGHTLSYHFSIGGSMLTILSVALLQLAVAAKVVLVGNRVGRSPLGERLLGSFNLELFLVAGLVLTAVGVVLDTTIFATWVASGYGEMTASLTSLMILGCTAVVVGIQLLFSAFFLGILRASYTGIWVD